MVICLEKGDDGIEFVKHFRTWVRTAFYLVVMALRKLKIAEYNFGHGPNFNLHSTLIFISLLVKG